MKKFMMIFIGSDYSDLGLSPNEIQERMGKWFAWNQKMSEQGIVDSGEALTPQVNRISGPNRTVTDNIAIESKELIGGYYAIKAKDLKAAKLIAQDYPDYDLGGVVELREIMVFEN